MDNEAAFDKFKTCAVEVLQVQPEQLTLDAPERGWREAEAAADVVRGRFGHAAVRPASLLDDRPAGPA